MWSGAYDCDGIWGALSVASKCGGRWFVCGGIWSVGL